VIVGVDWIGSYNFIDVAYPTRERASLDIVSSFVVRKCSGNEDIR